MKNIELSLRSRASLKTKITPRLWGRVKLANFMELPETDFSKFVMDIEKDPLFKKLSAVENLDTRIFRRRRFPGTDLAGNFCELNEETMSGNANAPDLIPLLNKWRELLPRIRKIGIENFKKFFLYNEAPINERAALKTCAITPSEIKNIKALLDDFYILDMAQPMKFLSQPGTPVKGSKIAVIEKDDKTDGFKIGYLSATEARGCYAIDYKKIYELNHQKKFSPLKFRKIQNLIKKIELINTRRTALHRILSKITKAQAKYFSTGKEESLNPLTQQMIALEMGVHRSTVHRAIENKYIETPQGELKNLRFLLTNRKNCAQKLICKITKNSCAALTDEALRRILKENYNISVARRTVCAYRKNQGNKQ